MASRVIMYNLLRRDNSTDDNAVDDFVFDDGFQHTAWYSKTAEIVKVSIAAALAVIFVAWVVLGHMHAKRRINKGLMPYKYHRWLVPRTQLARVDPSYGWNYQPPPHGAPGYGYYNGHQMHPVPPPIYDPNRPPMYEGPPEGFSKMAPQQSWQAPPEYPPVQPMPEPAHGQTHGLTEGDYQPPPGPPPPAATR